MKSRVAMIANKSLYLYHPLSVFPKVVPKSFVSHDGSAKEFERRRFRCINFFCMLSARLLAGSKIAKMVKSSLYPNLGIYIFFQFTSPRGAAQHLNLLSQFPLSLFFLFCPSLARYFFPLVFFFSFSLSFFSFSCSRSSLTSPFIIPKNWG